MTFKHKVLLAVNKIRFRGRVAKNRKKERSINEKATFEDYLLFRQRELTKAVAESFTFTDQERGNKKILQAKLDEVEDILGKYQEYESKE